MKMIQFAKILTGITMVLLVFLLVTLYGASLQASIVEFSVVAAPEQAQLAAELIETARRDDMGSDLFKRPTASDLGNYQLFTISVRAQNSGILPAQWLQLRVSPEVGDIALFSGDAVDLRPLGGAKTITATLLSEAQTRTDRRDIRLEYYVFGRRMEIALAQNE